MAFGVMINRRQLVFEIAVEKTKMCLMIRIEVIRHFFFYQRASVCMCATVAIDERRLQGKVQKRRTEY